MAPPVLCSFCNKVVVLVGGYVKLGARYQHVACHDAQIEIEVRAKVVQEAADARAAEEARRAEAARQEQIRLDAKRRAEQEAALQLQMAKAQADAAVAATIANEKARAAQFAPKPAATPSVSEAGERRIDLDEGDLLEAAAQAQAEKDRKARELAEIQEREAKAKAMLAGNGVVGEASPRVLRRQAGA